MITIGLYGIRDTTHGCAPTYTHDHGLAVMRGGRVVSVMPLERRTRIKHDNQLGRHLPALLSELALDDPVRFVSVNSFVGDGLQTDDGNLRIEPTAPVRIDAAPVPTRVRWFPGGLQRRDAAGWALCHEFAHVASLLPFVGRFEPRSLLTHIDGGASDSACSFWWWDGAQARLLEASWDRLKIPVNLFNVNPLVRAMLGFQTHEHLSIPGKLMGYAGHGQASPTLLAWLSEHRFFIDGPEDPQAILAIVNARFDRRWDAFDAQDSLCRDIAATIQRYFEDSVCEVLFEWQRKTGAEHLYYAGGAALNIPTNARLEGSGIFRSVHVPPCTNDTGLALGGAAWIEFLEHREVAIHGPFLASLGEISAPPRVDALDEIVESLAAGQVLGLCTGAAEVGPRALGHRSRTVTGRQPREVGVVLDDRRHPPQRSGGERVVGGTFAGALAVVEGNGVQVRVDRVDTGQGRFGGFEGGESARRDLGGDPHRVEVTETVVAECVHLLHRCRVVNLFPVRRRTLPAARSRHYLSVG